MNYNFKSKEFEEGAKNNWGRVSNKSPGERYNNT